MFVFFTFRNRYTECCRFAKMVGKGRAPPLPCFLRCTHVCHYSTMSNRHRCMRVSSSIPFSHMCGFGEATPPFSALCHCVNHECVPLHSAFVPWSTDPLSDSHDLGLFCTPQDALVGTKNIHLSCRLLTSVWANDQGLRDRWMGEKPHFTACTGAFTQL